MAAKKRARSKGANKGRPANRGNGGIPTRAQKRRVKQFLGAIKNNAKDIELRIKQVVDTLDSADWRDT